VPIGDATVLVRVDYNVPLTADGKIADDFRVTASLPTLRYLSERGCKLVLIAHLGRPDGKKNSHESLQRVAEHLGELLSRHVVFVPECIGDQVRQAAKKLLPGQIALLENLRFHAGEEANDPAFAEAIARDSGATYFVQDGFGVVHRAHASTDAITRFLPSVSGLLVESEWLHIQGAVQHPDHPMVAVLGGAKISDKIGVIEKFVAHADKIVIGGAMANTFLKYHGHNVGKSVIETGLESVIDKIYAAAEQKVGKDQVDNFLLLPKDVAVGHSTKPTERRVSVGIDGVADDEMILDIGSETIVQAAGLIKDARTVVWNGTLGYAELPQYSHGSARVAMAMAQNTHATTVIGGGDTADFVLHWDTKKGGSFTHVSTGGGASLELMSGLPMPGLAALLDS
jgi:3-phosphoglycerate kinase